MTGSMVGTENPTTVLNMQSVMETMHSNISYSREVQNKLLDLRTKLTGIIPQSETQDDKKEIDPNGMIEVTERLTRVQRGVISDMEIIIDSILSRF